MSQEQPRRSQGDQEQVKYDDISMETSMKIQSTIQSQAQWNGLDVSNLARGEGVEIMESTTDVTDNQSVGGQVVSEYGHQQQRRVSSVADDDLSESCAITIGEALEATAKTLGHKAVDKIDAAAIQAAEARATGSNDVTPGGLASVAQSTATFNCGIDVDECYKFKLRDILTDASAKLPADKRATQKDAEGVVKAELLNNPVPMTKPGGVAACVKTAATLNETIIM
ncbi:late embryogenesis abundant protein D-34-like [Cannabis sativa]|uniref:late embryogenesis abundant protein D-34-like n=1 Tax=Cannabis sativa TaxID=3483 RepID=UPI0029CA8DFD|nr:late embryogenesis abundant protein D-34-like [Cannabis sativa]